ncbi:MAG: Trm112 family protein, partial [candidate division WOR-3 bacterium]|nr:Trm112 family protein [candidate division WOR-3 bacterium]
MKRDVLNLLRCPACGHPHLLAEVFRERAGDEVQDGILYCRACRTWYPVEDGLLELLAGDLVYHDDRARFWESHADKLTPLGLHPDANRLESDQSRLQRRQQRHFDWWASNDQQTYTAYEQTPFWIAADRIAFAPWRSEIQPDKWLIDVGCAQGRSTFKILDLITESMKYWTVLDVTLSIL